MQEQPRTVGPSPRSKVLPVVLLALLSVSLVAAPGFGVSGIPSTWSHINNTTISPRPGIVIAPPFQGVAGNYSTQSSVSDSNSTVSQLIVPSFDPTTGYLVGEIAAHAVAPPTNTTSYSHHGAGITGYVTYTSRDFRSTASGIHSLRLDWWMAYQVNMTGSQWRGGSTTLSAMAWCWYSIDFYLSVTDKTTGFTWTHYADEFTNGSQPAGNFSNNVISNHAISMPTIIAFTAGDVYSFYLQIDLFVSTTAAGPGPTSAAATLTMGTPATPSRLLDVSIS